MDERLLSYKIFRAYKKAMLSNPSFQRRVLSLARPQKDVEKISSHSTLCHIDNDWVDYIESKMPFLMAAVKEERQFVRSEGEVISIDRVRSVSKDSIEDLGKHSNYLTHDPAETGGKVVPDRLLVVKKDSDYKVYENRFLYATLVYLSQFLELRLNEIIAVTGRYEGETTYTKVAETPTSSLTFELHLLESRLNDPVSANRGGSAESVRRISSCLTTTRLLLDTPLMKEVSSAPMVKSPITKTNILRFDPNFAEVMNLYGYLHSYSKKGYTVEVVSKDISPFQGREKEDFSLILFLSSFLTYEYSNGLEEELHKLNEENSKKEEEEADKELLRKLEAIKANLSSYKDGPEAYIQLLQEGEERLKKQLRLKDDEIAALKAANGVEAKRLAASFDKGLEKQQAEFDSLLSGKDAEVRAARIEANSAKEVAHQEALGEIAKGKLEAKQSIDDANAEKDAALAKIKEKDERIAELEAKVDELNAQLLAIKAGDGEGKLPDMSSDEGFHALERQKKAFDAYYEAQWKKAKKNIRKEVFAAPDPKSRKYKKAHKNDNEGEEGQK